MPLTPLALEGNVVRLEPLTAGHLSGLCAIGLDPALWELTVLALETRDHMAAYVGEALEAQQSGTALPFVIVDIASGRVAGSTRFHSFSAEHRRVEIGYTWIGQPWQRTAANTEAKYLLLRHAFEVLRCLRVEFKANVDNHVSRRALARLGATEEGILRSFRFSPRKGPCDIVQLSILQTEWPPIKSSLEFRLTAPRCSS
jgi:RimJ/RimL family protein N-acetyltransferase